MQHIKEGYDFNIPQGEYITGNQIWDGAVPVTITIQPGTDKAIFVKKIKFQPTNVYAMTALDVMTITINAYDNAAPQTIAMTATAVVAEDFNQIFSWCDPAQYVVMTLGAVVTHCGVLEFTPPVYLRSDLAVADSVVIEYTPTGGGVTAGEMMVTYEGWQCLEVNSGL